MITAELSFYPLTESYEQRVIHFVKLLREEKDLDIRTGGMSTLIRGDHDSVHNAVRRCSKEFINDEETVILVAKFLNKDAFEDPHID